MINGKDVQEAFTEGSFFAMKHNTLYAVLGMVVLVTSAPTGTMSTQKTASRPMMVDEFGNMAFAELPQNTSTADAAGGEGSDYVIEVSLGARAKAGRKGVAAQP